jgi:hypothetical protein
MEKEFIPYEQALALKELGFDEHCFGWYNWTGNDLTLTNNSYVDINPTNAPLYQQAFRWFREKYKLELPIGKDDIGRYYFSVKKSKKLYDETDYCFESYEEAELECLKKLIEIVKSK